MINQELAEKAKPYATLLKKNKTIYLLNINSQHKPHRASACFTWPHAYNTSPSFQAIKLHLLHTAEASEHPVSQFSPLFFFLPLLLIKATRIGNGVS